jgi:hypothetical protein
MPSWNLFRRVSSVFTIFILLDGLDSSLGGRLRPQMSGNFWTFGAKFRLFGLGAVRQFRRSTAQHQNIFTGQGS